MMTPALGALVGPLLENLKGPSGLMAPAPLPHPRPRSHLQARSRHFSPAASVMQLLCPNSPGRRHTGFAGLQLGCRSVMGSWGFCEWCGGRGMSLSLLCVLYYYLCPLWYTQRGTVSTDGRMSYCRHPASPGNFWELGPSKAGSWPLFPSANVLVFKDRQSHLHYHQPRLYVLP